MGMDEKGYNSNADRIDSMRKYLSTNDSGNIGIFWYLPSSTGTNRFIGVYKILASAITPNEKGIRVYPGLHKDLWKEVRRQNLNLPRNYTAIRRGRVSQNISGFELWVGSWYPPCKMDVDKLVKENFNLDQFEVIQDSHWDIGNGWDGY